MNIENILTVMTIKNQKKTEIQLILSMADFFSKHLPCFGARSINQFWDFLIPIYSPDPVLRLLTDKSTC